MRPILRFLLVGFVLLLCVPISRNDTNRRDGNWWRELDRPQKVNYMVGFFAGMRLGHNFSYWPLDRDSKNADVVAKVDAGYTEYETKYLGNVTNIQLVDGLDTFFSDYRNRRIETANAVWLVLNEISGKPDAEMQTMIESWRKNSAE
jgi:hypothetical protein